MFVTFICWCLFVFGLLLITDLLFGFCCVLYLFDLVVFVVDLVLFGNLLIDYFCVLFELLFGLVCLWVCWLLWFGLRVAVCIWMYLISLLATLIYWESDYVG